MIVAIFHVFHLQYFRDDHSDHAEYDEYQYQHYNVIIVIVEQCKVIVPSLHSSAISCKWAAVDQGFKLNRCDGHSLTEFNVINSLIESKIDDDDDDDGTLTISCDRICLTRVILLLIVRGIR